MTHSRKLVNKVQGSSPKCNTTVALLAQNAGELREKVQVIWSEEVSKASRCRRGYWWMSGTSIVQRALDNAWLREQGVPDLKAQWIELHYGFSRH